MQTHLALCLLALPVVAQESSLRFDAAQVVLSPDSPAIRRLVHLDGDGIPDAIGLSFVTRTWPQESDSIVGLYRGLGDGTYELLHTVTETHSELPHESSMVVLGDFDGDGQEDFAFTSRKRLYIGLLDGVHAPTLFGGWLTSEAESVDMEVRDLDDNGTDDLVILDRNHQFSIVRTAQDLNQTSVVRLYAPSDWEEVALLELNGEIHLAATHYAPPGEVRVAMYTLNAAYVPWFLQSDTTVPIGNGFTSYLPKDLIAGDIDSDGDTDLVLFHAGEFAVFRRQGEVLTLEPCAPGGPATDLFDIDQDGDLDGVCCGGGSGPNSTEALFIAPSVWELSINDGTGNFGPAVAIPGIAGTGWTGAMDVDGDGDLDLTAGVTTYFNAGALDRTGLGAARPLAGMNFRVDYDGDGDADGGAPEFVDGSLRYFENVGGGVFEPLLAPVVGAPAALHEEEVAAHLDADGDGDTDLLVRGRLGFGSTETYLVTNVAGTFHFGGALTGSPLEEDVDFGVPASLVVDFDQDGHPDLLQTYRAAVDAALPQPASRVLLNSGGGDFLPGPELAGSRILGLADIDLDGLDDLVAVRTDAGGLGWWKRLAAGGLGSFTLVPGSLDASGEIGIGDWDADGDQDLACYGNDGVTPVILENVGGGSFHAHSGLLPSEPLVSDDIRLGFRAADFDGDGRVDLIQQPSPTGTTVARLFRSTPGTSLSFEYQVSHALTDGCLVDADLDGDEDLVGTFVHRSLAESAVTGGSFAQRGTGTPGSLGYQPRLGVRGSVDAGRVTRLVFCGFRGGDPSLLVFGPTAAELVDVPVVGVTAYVAPATATLIHFPMGGIAAPGEGRLEVPVYVPPALAGWSVTLQAFSRDPGAEHGWSSTESLGLTIGTL